MEQEEGKRKEGDINSEKRGPKGNDEAGIIYIAPKMQVNAF